MTHDWFSHLDEGHNQKRLVSVGCDTDISNGTRLPTSGSDGARFILPRPVGPGVVQHNGREYLERAYKTAENKVTAWWDASQIYGYDEIFRTTGGERSC